MRMLCSITSKLIIRQAASRVAGEFLDCDYSAKHVKFSALGGCFRLESQTGIEV